MLVCPKCKIEYDEPHVDWIGGVYILIVCRNCGHSVKYEPSPPEKQSNAEYNRLHTQEFK